MSSFLLFLTDFFVFSDCVIALERFPVNFWVKDDEGNDCLQLARMYDQRFVAQYFKDRFSVVESLRDISARCVAKLIRTDDDISQLEIPICLRETISVYLERWDE